jgi:hypothetical protein
LDQRVCSWLLNCHSSSNSSSSDRGGGGSSHTASGPLLPSQPAAAAAASNTEFPTQKSSPVAAAAECGLVLQQLTCHTSEVPEPAALSVAGWWAGQAVTEQAAGSSEARVGGDAGVLIAIGGRGLQLSMHSP